MSGPNEELPDPKIGKVKNFSDLPDAIRRMIQDGIFLLLDGDSVHDGAIDLEALWGTLGKLDRLFRVIQAVKAGKDVGRDGRIPEVPGSRPLEAIANFAGSYALPLRLREVSGELVTGYGEVDTLFEILSLDSGSVESLSQFPERVGDDLRKLLAEIGGKGLDFRVEAIRGGTASQRVAISSEEALTRSAALDEKTTYDGGRKFITGKLFRIDTNKNEISIDVLQSSSKYKTEMATYDESQLETLRPLINKEVTAEVAISEERRPYEHEAKLQALNLLKIDRAAG